MPGSGAYPSIQLEGLELLESQQGEAGPGVLVRLLRSASLGPAEVRQQETSSGGSAGGQVRLLAPGNRQAVLPLQISGPDLYDVVLVQAQLETIAAQESFELRVCPLDGLPRVHRCYGGQVEVSQDDDMLLDAQGVRVVTVTCSVEPYGRSPEDVVVVGSGTPEDTDIVITGSPVLLDGFDTVGPSAGWSIDTNYAGAGRPQVLGKIVTLGAGNGYDFLFDTGFRPVAGSPVDLSVMSSLRMSVKYDLTRYRPQDRHASRSHQMTLTLRDSTGAEASVSTDLAQREPSYTWWTASWPLPPSGVNLAAVVSARVRMAMVNNPLPGTPTYSAAVWFDAMYGMPRSRTGVVTARGAVYQLPAVQGTVPADAEVTLEGAALGSSVIHRIPPEGNPLAAPLILVASSVAKLVLCKATDPVSGAEVDAQYDGTYAIWMCVSRFGSATGVAYPGVAIHQYVDGLKVGRSPMYQSGGSEFAEVDVTSDTVTTRHLIFCGFVSLPCVEVSPAAQTSYELEAYVGVGSRLTIDEVLLLDTRGPSAVVTRTGTGTYRRQQLRRPRPERQMGSLLASTSTATEDEDRGLVARSDLATSLSGGPLTVGPGDTNLLVWSYAGAPTARARYAPTWASDRLA